MKIKMHTKRKFFFWQNKANKSPVLVYVLLISNSLSLLKTQVSNKRPVVPKIRYSDLNAKYELPENEVDKYVKKKQKIIDVTKARKKKESEIIKAQLDAEKQKVEENKENVINEKNNNSDSNFLRLRNMKSTCNYKLSDIISAINDDEILKKVKCLFSDFQICSAERSELKKKLDETQETIKILTETCDNLEKINQKENLQKLDAIFDLLKQVANYILSDTSRDENYKQEKPKSNEDGQITCDIDIPESIYNHIVREKEPSSFITNMSYAVWGPEVLASRCVRSQANVVEQELTPTKKFAVINEFEKWMRIKRKMPQMLIDEQLGRSKINKYFSGAITVAARKPTTILKKK